MNTTWIIIWAVVLAVLVGVLVYLYFKGNKLQKEQAESREKLLTQSQQVTMLVIDKKRMPLKESGLPQVVIDSTPKRMRRAKVPVVKAKIGPRVTNLIADEEVYDLIPVKAEIRAMVSGIYITSINNFRKAPVPEPEKKGLMDKLRSKGTKASRELAENQKEADKAAEKKAKKNASKNAGQNNNQNSGKHSGSKSKKKKKK